MKNVKESTQGFIEHNEDGTLVTMPTRLFKLFVGKIIEELSCKFEEKKVCEYLIEQITAWSNIPHENADKALTQLDEIMNDEINLIRFTNEAAELVNWMKEEFHHDLNEL